MAYPPAKKKAPLRGAAAQAVTTKKAGAVHGAAAAAGAMSVAQARARAKPKAKLAKGHVKAKPKPKAPPLAPFAPGPVPGMISAPQRGMIPIGMPPGG